MNPLRWISVALISLYLFSVTRPAFVWIGFTMNRKAITNSCCINKNKPGMNCKGSCYLKKQISKVLGANGEKEKMPVSVPGNQEPVPHFVGENFIHSINENTMGDFSVFYLISIMGNKTNSEFHPPEYC